MGRSEAMDVDRADHEVSEKEKERTKRSDRERGRDKDRDKEKEKERERGKEKDRDREKEKERAKEKERDRLKEREKEKEREREKERGRREKEKDREKEKEKERDKHRERSGQSHDKEHEAAKEKDRDRHQEKSGHSKNKEHDRDLKKEKDVEREKEREKEKHVDKEKTKEKEERVREKHSDKDKIKDEEKVKERVKEKDRDKEKEKEKEREKEKEKEKRERERDREKEKEKLKEREREKEREQKEREKEKEREQREREKEREKEREQREREREREREKEKERDRERERERQRMRQKEQDRDSDRDQESDRDMRTRGNEDDHEQAKTRDSEQSHPSSSELADKISRMREERRKANFDRRPGRRGIRASEKVEEVDDISSWVTKSRQIDEKKKAEDKERAARMAKALEDQENEEEDSDDELRPSSKYSAKDLSGLKVRHGLDKVMEGGAVVLTLKDSNILVDGDLNDETDELENLEIAQQQAREDAYKAAKKGPGKYEDKFNNDITGNKTILSKYDDAVRGEGVTLDESGGVDEDAQKKLEEVRKRLQHGMGDRLAESLLTSTSTIASEYFTQDEMTQFKKPKKKKKLRKKEKLDLDALEAEAVMEGLGTGDMGSRESASRRTVMQEEMKAAADARRERYENAVAKAADASRILREESESKAMDVDDTEDVPTLDTEEDDILAKSLGRARQAALKKQAENAIGPQAVVARLAASRQERPKAGGDGEDGKLVFSDTGEFCRSLQLDEALTRRSGPKDVFHEEDKEDGELEDYNKDEEELEATADEGGWTEVKDVEMEETPNVAEEEEETLEDAKEVSVGRGLAGALSLLKERGTLKETVDWGGRNMDKKKSKLVGIVDESNNVVGQRDILLDRVDEFGRMMTPKEAFRKLSHKFHGKGPGKMKQEKKQKQFQEELKLKQMNAGDTPLKSMERIREAHARSHAPYIVISGHIKPGQTSDPRNGFATVEKEPVGSLTPMLGDNKNIGSLTPMLGDKKVAHFLGIKRKSDAGSMGPPPNKKPRGEH